MRTLLLSLIICISTFTNGQINFEQAYPFAPVSVIKLEKSGYKYIKVSQSQIILYNIDHSVFKQIYIPPQPGTSDIRVSYVTEVLFDSDSTDIEFVVTAVNISFDPGFVRIYKENGTLVFAKDSVWLLGFNNSSAFRTHTPIFNTDNGTKMHLTNDWIDSTLVYSLPGSLECLSCNTDIVIPTGMPVSGSDYIGLGMNPNPAFNITQINYTLPDAADKGTIVIYNMNGAELKRFDVNKSNSSLMLSVTDLLPGTYFYSLEVPGAGASAKKMVVVR